MITIILAAFCVVMAAVIYTQICENERLRKSNEDLTIDRNNLRNRVDVMHWRRMREHRKERNDAINTYIGKKIL